MAKTGGTREWFASESPGTALQEGLAWLSKQAFSSIAILCDEHTKELCYPVLAEAWGHANDPCIVVPAGESSKTLVHAEKVWQQMLSLGLDRHSLLVNLGGGMITDLGGFVAATYMRGIAFVHVPTTVLALVDAAIGGKTGLDLGSHKNTIGTFSDPVALVSDPQFLCTLPEDEWRTGLAEMLKHALIGGEGLWRDLANLQNPERITARQIHQSAAVKRGVVEGDQREQGQRKLLNFGHTLGHALEGVGLLRNSGLRHGDAVAAGMLLASWISWRKGLLTENIWRDVKRVLTELYAPLDPAHLADPGALLELARKDKKNVGGEIRMVLLEKIGQARYDIPVTEEMIRTSLDAYPTFYQ